MNDQDRLRHTLDLARRLRVLTGEMASGLYERMRVEQGDLRASRYDGARPQVADVSDPTGNAAGSFDGATIDLATFERELRRLGVTLARLEAVAERYPRPRRPNELDALELARLNLKPDPGCSNCARLEGPRGGPRWEPVDVDHPNPTTVEDRLAEPRHLCAWCYRATRTWGRAPSIAELERHHRGERVPWPKDVPRPDRRKGVRR